MRGRRNLPDGAASGRAPSPHSSIGGRHCQRRVRLKSTVRSVGWARGCPIEVWFVVACGDAHRGGPKALPLGSAARQGFRHLLHQRRAWALWAGTARLGRATAHRIPKAASAQKGRRCVPARFAHRLGERRHRHPVVVTESRTESPPKRLRGCGLFRSPIG